MKITWHDGHGLPDVIEMDVADLKDMIDHTKQLKAMKAR